MKDQRQRGGREAKARDRIGRHLGEAARQHRIDRPGERRDEGRGKSRQVILRERDAAAPDEQHDRAGERDHRADDVMRFQPLVRQQRRAEHDQQRPKVVHELRLGGGRKTQRHEEQRVVAEQPADAERPHLRRLLQRARGAGTEQPGRRAERTRNGERHRGELKRRHRAGQHGQQRQQRPHQDRGEADEGGVVLRHEGGESPAAEGGTLAYSAASRRVSST